jgi:hypothetical protein
MRSEGRCELKLTLTWNSSLVSSHFGMEVFLAVFIYLTGPSGDVSARIRRMVYSCSLYFLPFLRSSCGSDVKEEDYIARVGNGYGFALCITEQETPYCVLERAAV